MYYIFADIDGTIRQFDGSVPESTVRTIQRLRKNGNKVLICSGRPEVELEKQILAIGFDGIVSAGGARVTMNGKCYVRKTIGDELMRDFAFYAAAREYIVISQNYQRDTVLARQAQAYDMIRTETQKRLGKNAAPLLIKPEPVQNIADMHDAEKFMYFGSVVPTEAVTQKYGNRISFLPFSFPCPVPYGGEGCIPGVNKGTAIRSLAEAIGFDMVQTIGIGDSDNDLEMLATAGISIAMGNGTERARKTAKIVTDNIGDDGFANAFQKLGLV